jgi:hypothetical protein
MTKAVQTVYAVGSTLQNFIRKSECETSLKPCLHKRRLRDNVGNSDSHYLLTLATLGEVKQIGLFLFLVVLPKVVKASTVSCCCR